MVDNLIKNVSISRNGFYFNDNQKLSQTLMKLEKKEKTILFGVSCFLLDFQPRNSHKNSTVQLLLKQEEQKEKEKNILKRSYIKY